MGACWPPAWHSISDERYVTLAHISSTLLTRFTLVSYHFLLCCLIGYDCGIFTCMFADFLSRYLPLMFSQEHIDHCRERIAMSIMHGSILI
jgi:hypothetical protein